MAQAAKDINEYVAEFLKKKEADPKLKWKAQDFKKFIKENYKCRSKKGKEGTTKRKPSAYILFGKDERPKILSDHPDWKGDVVKVMKEVGARWNKLSDSEKAKYKA
jgi:hypothetical protein